MPSQPTDPQPAPGARARGDAPSPDEALELLADVYRSILSQFGDRVDARYALARVYLEQGKTAEAVQELQTIHFFAPQHAPAHLLLATLRYLEGQVDAAVEGFRAAAAHGEPEVAAQARFLLGSALHDQGKVEEATATFRALVEEQPEASPAWVALGNIHFHRHDLGPAIAAYRAALAASPGHEEAQANLAICLNMAEEAPPA